MNRQDLRKILAEEKFNPRSYSLDDKRADEALCVRRDEGGWCVYYSERGLETGKTYFPDEDAACRYFLDKIREDPTTRLGWKSGWGPA